ncbi:1-phosphofructokinase [Mycoplasmopsis californica]|uniref:PfkB family carbohydrate kinase n=1 Tax=Mycoplasmopsis equigenitalium TaxID=114883 RepID=A0ABY5J1D0_9BACT|nr:PfkB family carbohydrate kinase [Mycoplasmopsis equigenitalium]UUD37051.1 PfkB family carbohydrate kinase [Mycoplasmopsis equigenitalium]VEU69649.1 1-phosphofructokinase [Mycoplasmopsis californica]
MIYTITFAPCLDYVINSPKEFNQNGLNRISDFDFFPGGKGINASVILKRLGLNNTAIIFAGGEIGNKIISQLKAEKIKTINIKTDAETRVNVKFLGKNAEFEINGPRPVINEQNLNEYFTTIKQMKKDDFVFIMGISDENVLTETLNLLKEKGIRFALDIDAKNIDKYLEFAPYIYKPNIHETKNFLIKIPETNEEIKNALLYLKAKKVHFPIISAGAKGSYYLDENNNLLQATIVKNAPLVSAVGAGDTLIASVFYFLSKNYNIKDVISHASAMSIGTVTRKWLAQKNDINTYLDHIKVVKIKK